MSKKHPIIAITGSSGAGTTSTSLAFRKIFHQLNIQAATLEGDSFHRYTRPEMDMAIRKAREQGRHISYFGPEANDFSLLEQTLLDYSLQGGGQSRKYLHTYDEAVPYGLQPGTFTPWEPLPANSDVLFYEGLHGGVVTPENDVAQYVDLLVGVVPIVNLEWIQKLIRDTTERGIHEKPSWIPSYVQWVTILIILPLNFHVPILISNVYRLSIHPIHFPLKRFLHKMKVSLSFVLGG